MYVMNRMQDKITAERSINSLKIWQSSDIHE